jgi:hypothetical protein
MFFELHLGQCIVPVFIDTFLVYHYYALPPPKLGNSNISDQQDILSQVIPVFPNYKVSVLGDREFCSVKLAKYLQSMGVYGVLRIVMARAGLLRSRCNPFLLLGIHDNFIRAFSA